MDDLPKTLTGKIRRVELREQERERKQAETRGLEDRHQRDVPEDRRDDEGGQRPRAAAIPAMTRCVVEVSSARSVALLAPR